MREARRDPLVLAAALALLLAALVPGSWLHGEPEPGDPDRLRLGAWLWRGALALLGLFLLLTRRVGADEAAAHTRAGGRLDGLLLALLAAALVLRCIELSAGMWFDEVWMLVDFVRQPLAYLPRHFPTDNHHPLYSIAAWLSVRALGEGPVALRLPAVLFGVGSVAALYALGRYLIGRREALWAALLLTLSYHHVWFSQNARGYTGLLLFGLLACHGFLVALETGSRRAWLLQGTSLALASFLHVTGVLLAAAQLLIWLGRRRAAPACGLALGALLSLVLHALMLPQMVHFFLLHEDLSLIHI